MDPKTGVNRSIWMTCISRGEGTWWREVIYRCNHTHSLRKDRPKVAAHAMSPMRMYFTSNLLKTDPCNYTCNNPYTQGAINCNYRRERSDLLQPPPRGHLSEHLACIDHHTQSLRNRPIHHKQRQVACALTPVPPPLRVRRSADMFLRAGPYVC